MYTYYEILPNIFVCMHLDYELRLTKHSYLDWDLSYFPLREKVLIRLYVHTFYRKKLNEFLDFYENRSQPFRVHFFVLFVVTEALLFLP